MDTPSDDRDRSDPNERSTVRLMRHRRTPPGSPPGTLIADPEAAAAEVRVIRFGPDAIEEGRLEGAHGMAGRLADWPVTWIDVCGVGDVALIGRLGEAFDLHRLAIEDVANLHQRPKFEDYGDHVFIVTRMVRPETAPLSEQVSLFVGPNYVITFQEQPGDVFEPVRNRLRRANGPIRQRGPDYLAYALIDAVLDNYFPVLEDYGEQVERLENAVIEAPHRDQIGEIHLLKRELLAMRRAIWPQREMINAMIRDEARSNTDQTRVYLRDCYDHAVQLMDIVEIYRDITTDLADIYLSSVSARMNEVMKVLTIIATIFIPLSFIASVYGMNFDTASPWNMPEIKWTYGYPYALALMLAVGGGLMLWFWRRGWLGDKKRRRKTPAGPRRRRS